MTSDTSDTAAKAAAKPKPKGKGAERAERVKTPAPPGSIAEVYRAALPGSITFEAEQTKWDVALTVPAGQLREVLQVSREHPTLQMDLLRNQTAVDWTDQGLEVVYHLYSTTLRHAVGIKTWVPSESPSLPTVSDIWEMANWAERECREMFGIEFAGHPDPRNLLLDEDFDIPVLRKSHPLAPIEVKQGVDVEYFTKEHPREAPPVQKDEAEGADERAQRIAAAKKKASAAAGAPGEQTAPAEKKGAEELTPEELAEKKAAQVERVTKARALAAAARAEKAGGGAAAAAAKPQAEAPVAAAATAEAKPKAAAAAAPAEKKANAELSPEELAEKKAAQAERVKKARELAAKARAEKAEGGG